MNCIKTQATHKHTEYLETVSRNFGEKIKLVDPLETIQSYRLKRVYNKTGGYDQTVEKEGPKLLKLDQWYERSRCVSGLTSYG